MKTHQNTLYVQTQGAYLAKDHETVQVKVERVVKLTVVLRPDSTLEHEDLVAFCEDRLPRFMVPRYVEFTDALPRTPTDKVAKYKLKEQGDHGLTESTWDRESVGDQRTERTA